jgi:hypothetical protein
MGVLDRINRINRIGKDIEAEREMNVHAALLQHQDLTQKIIGCAYRVYKKLGFGFLESVYQNALLIELAREGLMASAGEPIQVYDGEVVGIFEADVLVEKLVLI